ncbi:hypothetical protein B5807_11455 [Epicoccum nigrum]|uniref:CCHC-type domain-containing protein n=1 Tax=Epicoccum nigrum TaxID=105696 RepID=A0A1Y2LIX2_EPING|nr:hypothetical protein B5807_11455 [Epicoccum nigrum]
MQTMMHGHLLPTLATLGELLGATEAMGRAEMKETMASAEAEEMTPVACTYSFSLDLVVLELTLNSCGQTGHFARECPDKPAGGGLTGECYNCGEVGHNKADCPNPRVEREFTGTCNSCGVEGHAARNCPTNPMKCRLCDKEGHKALDCKERRLVDWTGIPELESGEAWRKLVDAARAKDLDAFRNSLKAYARSLADSGDFDLVAVEETLRTDCLPIFLIAKKQEVAPNMTVIDMLGNPDRKYVLTVQLSDKPRRAKLKEGWPENAEQNKERLASAGFLQDRGVPLCSNCGELGHIKKVSVLDSNNPPL